MQGQSAKPYNRADGPSRMVKRPTGSGGEPSSPNCGVSAGVKARHLSFWADCPQRSMVFLRYFLAGGVATATHYGVLLAFVELLGLPAAAATVMGALCGAVVAYFVNRTITFTAGTAPHRQALPRFMLVAVLGAALNGLLVWYGVHGLGAHYLAAQGMSTVAVLGLTYRLNRSWTFAR